MMEIKVGDSIKRPHWTTWATVIQMRPGEIKLKGHIKGSPELAFWYGVGLMEWEKQEPNVAKVGDIITDGYKTYSVYEVDDTGKKVRLQNVNTLSKLTLWFFLPKEQHWSINGVLCSEFFGEHEAKKEAPPVDVPARKKRIYNA